MKVTELNREQLLELKEQYLIDWYDSLGKTPSWSEIADADSLVDDETVIYYFDGIEFVEEDFVTKSLSLQK